MSTPVEQLIRGSVFLSRNAQKLLSLLHLWIKIIIVVAFMDYYFSVNLCVFE